MKTLLFNILLALLWVLATGALTLANLALGFIIGFIVLGVSRRVDAPGRYLSNWWHCLRLALFFLRELVTSSLRVAHDVLTPTHHMQPAILAVPLDAKTDAEITVLASLITLTPGTLCLDVSTDRKVMYLHAMYVHDEEEFKRCVKSGIEAYVMKAMR
ncbi:MAG TPA: Na+/H+ antiporter subunit E [Clostridia bacterium]|nr:Na+/H+ antiporter subunit E [Clostridia bacterium]